MVFALLANLLGSFTNPITKILITRHNQLTILDILYWNGLISVLFFILFAKAHGVFVMDIPYEFRKSLIARGFSGFFGIAGM
jgi:hypothetical protein